MHVRMYANCIFQLRIIQVKKLRGIRNMKQTTEWDQCERRRRTEWCQPWQNVIRQADDDRMRPVRETTTEWVVPTMTECDTSGRRWQNEISARDDDGMSGANHDRMWYVRQTMTEWDQCGRRRRNEWCQPWQNVIRQADDDRMRPVRQTIMGTYGILNGKPEGKKTLWSFKVEVCGLNDVMYG